MHQEMRKHGKTMKVKTLAQIMASQKYECNANMAFGKSFKRQNIKNALNKKRTLDTSNLLSGLPVF